MNEEERLVEVKLIGELGRRFGRVYKFWVRNPRDVISALSNQLEGFKEYLSTAHENGVGFRLVTREPEGITYDEMFMTCDRLVIAPIVTGAGDVGKILIGVALVALSFVSFGGTAFAGAAGAFGIFGGTGAAWGSTLLFSIGASLLFTGIAGMLSPTIQTPGGGSGDSKKKESFLFDRAAELTTQGYPVPIVYGKFLVTAPLIISSSISTQQIPV